MDGDKTTYELGGVLEMRLKRKKDIDENYWKRIYHVPLHKTREEHAGMFMIERIGLGCKEQDIIRNKWAIRGVG